MQLFSEILFAVHDQAFDWSDAYIQPGLPVMLRTPSGNRSPEPRVIALEEIEQLAAHVWKASGGEARAGTKWDARLKDESIKEAIDIESMIIGEDSEVQPPPTRLRFIISSANAGQSLSLVVRKTPQAVPTLKQLGFPPHFETLTSGNGLVMVTGPTGHGKSTTVAAFIEDIRTKNKASHIVITGDPLEFTHPSTPSCAVTSRQVGIDVKDYRTAAEDAMRMAPRVIEFGEIRDTETAMAALMLGESGHLVFTTMQASTVEGAIAKLITLTAQHPGARESIAKILRGVIRPALVPSIDGDRWCLAHEFMLNEGSFQQNLANKPDDFTTVIRQLLRSGDLKRYGIALNHSLKSMVQKGEISEEAALTVSNDLDISGGTTALKLKD
jgi:twitching motility protein PilT